ncbi:Uncharacterised protein [Mycobacterium tuberculosis]|nr:Uncharacterised protein [Mycobacterium tuberculosis]
MKQRQPGETQAICCAGDGQSRSENDVSGAPVHRVERGFAILADMAGFLIAADQEDRVVCTGSNGKCREDIDHKSRKADHSVVSKKGNGATRRAESNKHHGKNQQRGGDRAIDEQQQHGDYRER